MNSLDDKINQLKDLSTTIISLQNDIAQTVSQNQKLRNLNVELENKIQQVHLENQELLALKNKLTDTIEEKNREISTLKENSDPTILFQSGSNFSLGINNLLVRNKEAIHDALTYFDKRCPYCKEELFQTTNRKQYEIDHFFPVVKGGQDLPWNLLPVCQNCNRKKRDILPNDFLNIKTYQEVSSYLEKVHQKYLDESIDSYTFKEKLQELIEEEYLFVKYNIKTDFITTLLYLAEKHNILRVESLQEQQQLTAANEKAALIVDYLDKEIPEDWANFNLTERKDFLARTEAKVTSNKYLHRREFVCVAEICCECLGMNREDLDRNITHEINLVMKSLFNWKKGKSTKRFPIYGPQRFYERKKYKA